MIAVISGTNRPDNLSRHVGSFIHSNILRTGKECHLIDLRELPPSLFLPESYVNKPPEFEAFQEVVLKAEGILCVVPEYNGSFPGVLKYFIDMLQFPQSLFGIPVAFVGLSAGRWGGLRGVEQLEMVFQYRQALLFGQRVFLPGVGALLDKQGSLIDSEAQERLIKLVQGFLPFCEAVAASKER